MISETENRKRTEKPLGIYLVEAGIITPKQVKIALEQQKLSQNRRLGEILASHGWVEQQTIDYIVEKIILPERQSQPKQLSYSGAYQSDRLKSVIRDDAEVESHGAQQLPSSSRELKFLLYPHRITRFLLVVISCLVAVSFCLKFTQYYLQDYPLRDLLLSLFDINGEQNIPALYSWSALIFSAILLATIAQIKKLNGERYISYWRGLAIIFAYLSLDEAMSIHEKFVDPLHSRFNTSGIFHYAWVIPASILVIIFGITFYKFFTTLPSKTKRLFLIAGVVFVTGALGLEMVAGIFVDEGRGDQNIVIAVLTSIEEFMEMSGIAIFIYALLTYINTYLKGWSVKIECANKLDTGAQF